MPTYDYRCTKCKHRFELFHSITDDAPKRCPRCKARAVRLPVAGAGLLFKGSGFYITDYRSKNYRDKAKQEGSASKSEGSAGKSEGSAGKSEGSAGKSEGSAGKTEGSAGKAEGSKGGKAGGEKKGGSGAAGAKGG